MAGGLYLPVVNFAAATAAATTKNANIGDVPDREQIASVATSTAKQQLVGISDWAPARVVLGRDRIGANLYRVDKLGSKWVILLDWGYGPWDGIESFEVGGTTLPAGASVTHHDGSQTTHDAVLAQALGVSGDPVRLAQMVYPNWVYSVLQWPISLDIPTDIAAVWRGMKLYDHRTGLTVWSDTAILAFAAYRASAVWGMGRTIDWTSVDAIADLHEVLLGGEKRCTINLTLDSSRAVDDWSEALRTYAECWVLDDGATCTFVPDAPADAVMDFVEANGDIAAIGPIQLADASASPNVVSVKWTDTSETPWRERQATAYANGANLTGADVRLAVYALPGIHAASQAQRTAIQILNKGRLTDITTPLTTFDRGAAVAPGQVIRVTHQCGLALKAFRVVSRSVPALGDNAFQLREYDAACYSTVVVDTSSTPDTDLPDPGNPPAPSGLTLVEEVYQQQDGTWSSRIKATWNTPDWSFLVGYRVDVREAGKIIVTGTPGNAEYRTPAVQEGKTYAVSVSVVARGGAVSPAAQSSILALGKYLAPGPVPAGSFLGFEAGGVVYLRWSQATDIDIWRYRIKRGTTAQSYADAAVVDLVDALRYTDRTAPVGTWRYWVESVDSVRLESGTPRSLDIEVTLDTNAFLGDTLEHTAPTLVNMVEYHMSRIDPVRHFVSSDGATWNDVFTGPMNSYTDPLLSYFDGAASSWTGEAEDFGLELSGSWRATGAADAISGAVASELQLATEAAPSTWLGQGAMTAKANARFGRISHTAAIGSVMHIQIPDQSIRIDAIPREESIDFTSSASGPVVVTLANEYTKFISVRIETSGATALIGQPDNEQTGSPSTVDCRIIDASNALVAASGRLIVKGV